jgi:hypothetical protein
MLDYLLQTVGLGLFIGFCAGRHDAPAVDNFTFFGNTPKQNTQFHRFNWLMKLGFISYATWVQGPCSGLIFLCTIWGLFDPVVALFRTVYTVKKPWYYLSAKSNATDRVLLRLFGEKAGVWKAAFCLAGAIAALYIHYRWGW